MGVRKRAFRGVFIGENAHRSRSPCLHLQGKWSIDRRSQRTAISYPLMMPLACNLVSLFGWSKGRSESRWGEIRVTAVRITWALPCAARRQLRLFRCGKSLKLRPLDVSQLQEPRRCCWATSEDKPSDLWCPVRHDPGLPASRCGKRCGAISKACSAAQRLCLH